MLIKAILVPHAVAEVCYLSEALMWVAFNRFPLGAPIHESWDDDSRRDMDHILNLDPSVDVEDPTDRECVSVGLSQRPTDVTGLSTFPPEYLKEALASADLENRIQLEQALQESIVFREGVARREGDLSSFLDLHRARLFIALREGKLVAEGIKLPEKSYEASLTRLRETDWEGWSGNEWISIPPDFWHSETINWTKCLAEGRDAAFALIQIETEQLFACFPPPSAQAADVVRVANDLIAVEQEGGDESMAPNSEGVQPLIGTPSTLKLRCGSNPIRFQKSRRHLLLICRSGVSGIGTAKLGGALSFKRSSPTTTPSLSGQSALHDFLTCDARFSDCDVCFLTLNDWRRSRGFASWLLPSRMRRVGKGTS
jgi:hypothetical protein